MTNSQAGRRRFLSAVAVGALTSVALARQLRAGESTIATPQWKGYAKATVIDALCSPGSANKPGKPMDAADLADIRTSGLSAVNLTVGGGASYANDYAEAIEYTMNIVGEDSIGIGTDFTQGHGQDFFEMLTHDKGYARRLTSFGKIINPLGIRTVGEFPNLTETLLKRGHSERVVRKIMGENWVNVLKDVWGE